MSKPPPVLCKLTDNYFKASAFFSDSVASSGTGLFNNQQNQSVAFVPVAASTVTGNAGSRFVWRKLLLQLLCSSLGLRNVRKILNFGAIDLLAALI